MGLHYRSALVLSAIVSLTWSIAGLSPSFFLHAAAMGAAAAQETDTDGDTMPDAWETFFGLDPNSAADATGDPDGDGLSNAQEYAARRHPKGHHARYFAEGSTGYFDTTMAVLNLSSTQTAHVALAMLNEAGGVVSHQFSLDPLKRQSMSLSSIPGVSGAVSIIVESDVPVAADRTMTWGTSGLGLSLDSGSPGPATSWYFAEGATGPFLLYYLFENPGPTPANVSVRYLIEGAPPVTKTHTFGPYSRTTIFVNGEDPALANTSLGAVISSDVPILAERAMYVQSGGAFGGGAASSGANQLSTTWFFGEGATGPFFHCFLSLINPGGVAATATVTYHMSDGSTASKAYTVPAEGRRTVYLNGEGASDPTLAPLAFGPVWFTVVSTQPVLGERAMWWSTWPWYEGHAAPGSVTTDFKWAVPEGRHGGTDFSQTYVLIGNASPSTAGQVRVTLIPDAGASSTLDFTIAGGERLTLNVGEVFGLANARFSVLVESLGSPGVPLTVDYARYRSVNGVPFSGGGAAPAVAVTAAEDFVPSVSSTTPAANATDVAVDANLTVTFSEAVNVTPTAFTLECPSGTPIALTNLTPSPATTFTLDPNVNLPVGTACVLRIAAAQVTDVDTVDPPDTMAVDVNVPFTTSTCAAITVTSTPSPAPGGNLTLPYGPVTYNQTGAVDPVTWTISSGALPAGMNLSAAGVLDGTPTASGTFNVTVRAGTAAGCAGTLPVTISIASGPNEPPSFTVGPNPTVLEDAGPQTIANWATGISPGAPPDEAGQIITFTVTGNTNAALFAVAPAVSSTGTLTFTTAPNAIGSASITLVAQDNGGTALGGDDTSDPQNFTITVTPVNDAPGFTVGADQTVFENAGAQNVPGWATAISTGPADEAGQTVTFNVTNNTNPTLFSAGPAVAADGTLTFTPATDANGTATISLTLSDNGGTADGGIDTSAPPQTFTITVTAVNSQPSFTVGPDQTVGEDAGPQSVTGWATAISAGPPDESGQVLTFNVTNNSNPTLFGTAPAVAADGTLTYTPAADTSGTATITLTLSDDGGTANGGIDTSAAQIFVITVNDVNDAPSFTKGADQTVLEDAGAQSVSGWATALSAGPPNEVGQTLSFDITGNTNPSLFSGGPLVAPDGTLTYTPAANANGSATITLNIRDNGGTANGGVETSPSQTFVINVTAVNDVPSFTAGGNQTVDEDSGAQSVSGWATAISAGPADEASQVLTFNITGNTNPSLFSAGPAVATDGTLTFTPAANASGSSTITLTLSDDGGTANGGVDTSGSQNFTITVNAVNDPPSFTGGGNQSSAEDAGAQSFTNWATAISPGPADESGQTVSFVVTGNTNTALFTGGGQPAVSSTGTLTYTSAPDAFGTADITIVLQDNGGGTNQSAPYNFTITVTPVNDAPMLTNALITYSTLGNTQLHVAGASEAGLVSIADTDSALTKSGPSDIDGPAAPAAVPQTAQPTTNGGVVTVASNGSFTYVPPVGFTGTDSFTAQVTDSVTPVNLTVQISVGQVVWYVSNQNDANNPASGSDGRSSNAFETLAAVEAASSANHTIFVFRGITSTTPLTGGITLKNGQKFLGEGVGLTIAPFGTLVPADAPPIITTAGTNAVTVLANTGNGDRTGIEIRGHELGSTGANAIDVTSQNTQNIGVLINNNTIAASGAGLDGIEVNQDSTGAATLAIHDNSITSGGTAINITRTAGTATITTFDDNTIPGANAGQGIVVSGATFDATPLGTFQAVSGGTTNIGASGNGVVGGGLTLTNVSGALDFTTLNVFTDTGDAVTVSGTGVFNAGAGTGTRVTFGAVASTLSSAAGAGLLLSNLTADAQLASLTSTGSTTAGVSLNAVTGDFSAPSGSTITNAGTTDFLITGGSGTVAYGGTITDDVGTLVSITSSAGNKTFTGAISDGNDGDGSGISLSGNTGTITFAGGLTLSTGANAAFTASGGTLTVCDDNPCNGGATGGLVNQITTTTGTALNVSNLTIAASHLEFRSISSDGTGSGNGIVLSNTGSSGGLKVKGSGSAGSGGTIRDMTIGISLTSTQHVSLDRMQLNDFADFAIRGDTVNNFTLANSTINGTNGTDFATDEGSVRFTGLTGVASVTATSISGGLEDNFKVINSSGSLNRLTFDNVTIGANSTTLGNDGIGVEGSGTAVVNVTIQNSFFTSSRGDLFHWNILGGNADLIFSSNTLSNNHPAIATGGGGVTLISGSTAVSTLAMNSNTFRDALTHAVLIVKDIGTGTMTGSFTNNQIGVAGDADSGSLEGDGLKIQQAGQGTMTMTVTGNAVRQYNNHGIDLQAGAGVVESGNFNVTVSGNTISNPGTNPSIATPNQGLHLNSGVQVGDTFAVCVAVGANSLTNSGRNAGGDFRFRQRQDTTVKLPGYGGAAGDTTAVVNFLNAAIGGSPVGGTASANFPTGGGGFIGGASCP